MESDDVLTITKRALECYTNHFWSSCLVLVFSAVYMTAITLATEDMYVFALRATRVVTFVRSPPPPLFLPPFGLDEPCPLNL